MVAMIRQQKIPQLYSICFEVPCFSCLLGDRLRLSYLQCKPETCNLLTEWLRKEAVEKIRLLCPRCSSEDLVKCGCRVHDGILWQYYQCKTCFKKFSPRVGYKKQMRTRQEIVDYARRLAAQTDPAFSTRDIAKQIKTRFNVSISHAAVSKWLAKE